MLLTGKQEGCLGGDGGMPKPAAARQTAGCVCGEGGSLITVSSTFCSEKGGGGFRKSSRDRAKEGRKELKGRKALRSSARWLVI